MSTDTSPRPWAAGRQFTYEGVKALGDYPHAICICGVLKPIAMAESKEVAVQIASDLSGINAPDVDVDAATSAIVHYIECNYRPQIGVLGKGVIQGILKQAAKEYDDVATVRNEALETAAKICESEGNSLSADMIRSHKRLP